MSSTTYVRTTGKSSRRSGSARARLGGVAAALVLGGAVAVVTILTHAPDAAVPAAQPRSELASPAIELAGSRPIDREIVDDAARSAAWTDGSATEDGDADDWTPA